MDYLRTNTGLAQAKSGCTPLPYPPILTAQLSLVRFAKTARPAPDDFDFSRWAGVRRRRD